MRALLRLSVWLAATLLLVPAVRAAPRQSMRAAPHGSLAKCPDRSVSGVWPDAGDIASHREFQLPVIRYPPHTGPSRRGLHLLLQVDAEGRVTCFVIPHMQLDEPPFALNKRRRAVLRLVTTWRYKPFLRNGKPAAAVARERVRELPPVQSRHAGHAAPPEHVMPWVPLDEVAISLTRSVCPLNMCPSYEVTIQGNGTVDYVGRGNVAVTGSHSFKIPKGDVAKLVKDARREKMWSMGRYWCDVTDSPFYTVRLIFGGETHDIFDHVGAACGMPKAVSRFEREIDQVGHTSEWTHLSMVAVRALQKQGYDFHSEHAGDMLARAVADRHDHAQRAMLKMIELGTPTTPRALFGMFPGTPRETSLPLVDRALFNDREMLIGPLIARGALLTEGKPDRKRIDDAFRYAIRGGRLSAVEAVWNAAGPVHPALFFQHERGLSRVMEHTPVTLLLHGRGHGQRWQGLAIAKWLVAKGCGLRGHNREGETLLHIAVQANAIDFVRYLLAHGLSVSVPDSMGLTSLAFAKDQNIALLLLRSDPHFRDDMGHGYLIGSAKRNGWTRVLAWLSRHGVTTNTKGMQKRKAKGNKNG